MMFACRLLFFCRQDVKIRDAVRDLRNFTHRKWGYVDPDKVPLQSPGEFLHRKDGKIFAEFEIPGIDPSRVELNVFEDRLTLKAEKADEKTVDENDVFRSERYYGTVSRSIQFPVEVDPDSAKAAFKNGVLTVEVAEKVQAEKMKKVAIEGQ